MNMIKIFQIDAFTETLFAGNPAAVCLLEKWLTDELMQSIAGENNLAETAFVVVKEKHFEIRWFTPTIEVDLCGHATLASAFALFNCLSYNKPEIRFFSPRSGALRVFRDNDILFLDFPSDDLKRHGEANHLTKCIGVDPVEIYRGRTDYLAVLQNEEQIASLRPDFTEIAKLPARGLIVTAKGDNSDFVSRFFAPQSGINEDPVTGSAHTSLIPLWSGKLGKTHMSARQLSQRGGSLTGIYKGERCYIGGKARLYLTGEINVN